MMTTAVAALLMMSMKQGHQLFGTTREGNSILARVYGFEPYFCIQVPKSFVDILFSQNYGASLTEEEVHRPENERLEEASFILRKLLNNN